MHHFTLGRIGFVLHNWALSCGRGCCDEVRETCGLPICAIFSILIHLGRAFGIGFPSRSGQVVLHNLFFWVPVHSTTLRTGSTTCGDDTGQDWVCLALFFIFHGWVFLVQGISLKAVVSLLSFGRLALFCTVAHNQSVDPLRGNLDRDLRCLGLIGFELGLFLLCIRRGVLP